MPRTVGWRGALAPLVGTVAVVTLALGLGACSSDADDAAPAVDRGEFAARLAERTDIAADQASCVTDEIYAQYDPEEVALLHDEGLASLQPARWSFYVQAFAGCVLADGEAP